MFEYSLHRGGFAAWSRGVAVVMLQATTKLLRAADLGERKSGRFLDRGQPTEQIFRGRREQAGLVRAGTA